MKNQVQHVKQTDNQSSQISKNSKRKLLLILVCIVLLLVICGIYYLTYQNHHKPSLTQGVTPSPTLAVTISPTPNIQDKGNYKIYTNTQYSYQVRFPSYLEVTEEDAPFSVLFNPISTQSGPPGFPTFYISVISGGQNDNGSIYNRESKETIDKFYNSNVGEKIATSSNTIDASFFTFTKLPNISINGRDAIVVENNKVWEGGNGLIDRRIFVKRNGNTYMIGSYYQTSSELNDFNTFLSNFKFTN